MASERSLILLLVLSLAACDRRGSPQSSADPGKPSQKISDSRLATRPGVADREVANLPQSALAPKDPSGNPAPVPKPEFRTKDPAVQDLVSRFFKAAPADQDEILQTLLERGSAEALEGLVHVLHSLKPGDRKTRICQELSQIDTREQRDILLGLMPSADPDTRRALAIALGAQADSALVMRLIDRFDSTDEVQARDSAQLVMSAIQSPAAMETLAAVVTDPINGMSDPMVAAAADALARAANPPGVNALLQKMSASESREDSEAIGKLIAAISNPIAESALIFAARGNKDAAKPAVRLAAVRALENFPTLESLAVLQQLQRDDNPDIRAASAAGATKIQAILGR
jgi:HEAT repeat protein